MMNQRYFKLPGDGEPWAPNKIAEEKHPGQAIDKKLPPNQNEQLALRQAGSS